MIPANSTVLSVAQGGQNPGGGAAQARLNAAAPGQPNGSAGVTAPANLRTETAEAIDPSRQSAVAPRLRDQETTERSERAAPPRDGPTGPTPSFEETPMQRASRTIFDPPAPFRDVATQTGADVESAPLEPVETSGPRPGESAPSPDAVARQAEAAFAEAKKLEDSEAKAVDIAF